MLSVARFRNVSNNQLVRNFTKLFAGSAAAKLITFITMPIITRLVGPENFGELSIFVAIVMMTAPILSFRYVDAIPIPKSSSRATSLLSLSLVLIFFNATFFFFLGLTFLGAISAHYSFVNSQVMLLLYFSVVGVAIFEALSLWAVRVRGYGTIAKVQVGQALVGVGLKTIAAYIGVKFGLLWGQVAQDVSGLIFLARSKAAPFTKYSFIFSYRYYRNAAIRFDQYPKFRLASQFMLVVTQALPILAVGRVFGPEEAGQLGLAFSVITVPLMMIMGNVRKLYYGEAACLGKHKPDQLLQLTLKIMSKMAMVAAPACLLMYLSADLMFEFVFGSGWVLAGEIASLYSVYAFFLFVSGSFVDLLNVLDKQRVFLVINFIRLLLVGGVFGVLSLELNFLSTVAAYSYSMAVFYFSLAVYFLSVLCRFKKVVGSA